MPAQGGTNSSRMGSIHLLPPCTVSEMQLSLGSHSFGCWEQSHTIKSDGLGIILLSRQRFNGVTVQTPCYERDGESKTGSQLQVDAHKKEAKCQYKEG